MKVKKEIIPPMFALFVSLILILPGTVSANTYGNNIPEGISDGNRPFDSNLSNDWTLPDSYETEFWRKGAYIGYRTNYYYTAFVDGGEVTQAYVYVFWRTDYNYALIMVDLSADPDRSITDVDEMKIRAKVNAPLTSTIAAYAPNNGYSGGTHSIGLGGDIPLGGDDPAKATIGYTYSWDSDIKVKVETDPHLQLGGKSQVEARWYYELGGISPNGVTQDVEAAFIIKTTNGWIDVDIWFHSKMNLWDDPDGTIRVKSRSPYDAPSQCFVFNGRIYC